MSVLLYSTNCPKCKILKKKLSEHNIEFEEITDIDIMLNLGIMSAPILCVNNNKMDFQAAIKWIGTV